MTNTQERLEALLKKKGIGPEGSKRLNSEELSELNPLFLDPTVSLTTKATILTALLLLKPNQDENNWLVSLKAHPENILPKELLGYIRPTDDAFLILIKKIISLEELSKEECTVGMNYFFDINTPEYLKGSFLEAERLKRESFIENKTFFDFLYKKATRIEIEAPIIIDICDSYDGSNRSRNYSLFTAALLASLGFPTMVNGIDEVAPKKGVTSHGILKAAGKNPLLPLHEVADNIQNPEIRWGYVDQKIFLNELYQLKNMRKEMVKRPFLATFEKLLQPARSKNGNYIVTGFTHPHYKEELVKQLKEQGQCKQALILKGVEGSTHMSLSRNTTSVLYDGVNIIENSINPQDYNLPSIEAKQDKSVTAADSYNEGLAALQGEKNYARENILYLSTVILHGFNLMDKQEALIKLQANLDSGKALAHWEKGNK